MREADDETVLAYYLYVQHGWPPGKFLSLSDKERLIVAQFAARESEEIAKLQKRR